MAENGETSDKTQNNELENLKLKLNDVLQSISSLQSEEGKLQALDLLKSLTSEAQSNVLPPNSNGNVSSAEDAKPVLSNNDQEIVPDNVAPHCDKLTIKIKKKVGRPRKSNSKKVPPSLVDNSSPESRNSHKRKSLHPRRICQEVGTSRTSKRIKTAEEKVENEKEMNENDDKNVIGELDQEVTEQELGKERTLRKRHKWLNRREISHSCNECQKSFSHGKSFKVHVRTHGEARVCCIHCRLEFYNSAELGNHSCKAMKSPSKRAHKECRICHAMFTNMKLYETHLVREHKEHPEPRYKCKFCSRCFARKNYLRVHLRQHAVESSKVVCMVCGEFLENLEALTEHEQHHKANAEATCNICGMYFMRAQQYDQHALAHEKYDCKICNRPFYRKKSSLKHQKAVHNVKMPKEPKKYECPTCGKKMQRPGMLEIHMRIHTGEKPIECQLCHLFFRTPKAFTKHKLTNTHMKRSGEIPKEREFMCELCGSSYYRKQALQRHMNASHFKEKLYKCPHCEFACTEHSNLRVHINLHFDAARNFVCELCGSAFHTKKTLHEHTIYKHTEDRNFPCDVCSMSFKTKNALVRHAKTHESEKPYVCICGTAFRRSYNLRRHAMKIHGTDSNLPPVRRVQVLDTDPRGPQNPLVTSAPKKRMSKPKEHNQISTLLSIPNPEDISVVTLQTPVVDSNINHKAVESFEDAHHMPSSFLEQLASAVEYGREEVVAAQPLDTSTHELVAKSMTSAQEPKNIIYKWHQIPPQNIRLQPFTSDGTFTMPIPGFYPATTDNVRYATPVTVQTDSIPREQYSQEMFTVMQYTTPQQQQHH